MKKLWQTKSEDETVWCRPNSEANPEIGDTIFPNVPQAGSAVLFNWIQSFESREELINAISPSRGVIWNFQNALEGGCGTVEFRLPPASNTWEVAAQWSAFAVAFVHFAITAFSPAMLASRKRLGATVDLRAAIINAADALDVAEDVRNLMQSGGLGHHKTTLSIEEQIRIKNLKEQKKVFFIDQVCYYLQEVLCRTVNDVLIAEKQIGAWAIIFRDQSP